MSKPKFLKVAAASSALAASVLVACGGGGAAYDIAQDLLSGVNLSSDLEGNDTSHEADLEAQGLLSADERADIEFANNAYASNESEDPNSINSVPIASLGARTQRPSKAPAGNAKGFSLAPTVASTDVQKIFAGLTPSAGVPVPNTSARLLYAASHDVTPIITTGQGNHVGLIGRFEEGRVAVFSKEEYFRSILSGWASTPAHHRIFVENTLNWLTENQSNGFAKIKASGGSMKVLTMAGMAGVSVPNVQFVNMWFNDTVTPAEYPVAILTESLTDADVLKVKKYMAAGGAVIINRDLTKLVATGEVLSKYNTNFTNYPMVKLMKEMGFIIRPETTYYGKVGDYPMLQHASPELIEMQNPINAQAALSALIKREMPTDSVVGVMGADELAKIYNLAEIAGGVSQYPTSINSQNAMPDYMVIANQKLKDAMLAGGSLDCAEYKFSCAYLRVYYKAYRPVANTPRHITADIWPGVSKNGVVTPATVVVDGKTPGRGYGAKGAWVPTQRWINGGENITITVAGTADPELDVIIGSRTDVIDHKSGNGQVLKRLPKISWRARLKAGVNVLSTPVGGMVFFDAIGGNADKSISVTIDGAMLVPHYIANVTPDQEFIDELKSSDVPWVYIESERGMYVVSRASALKIQNPTKLVKYMDGLYASSDKFHGLDAADSGTVHARTPVKELWATGKHLSLGYMHSGYPIMIPLETGDHIVRASAGASDWGFAHEHAHNMQSYPSALQSALKYKMAPLYLLDFHDTADVTNNIFSLYRTQMLGGPDGLVKTGNLGYTAAWSYLNNGSQNKKFASDTKPYAFDGLVFYAQYAMRYGWDFYAKLFRAHRDHAYGVKVDADIQKLPVKMRPDHGATDADRANAFALFASKVSGFDQRNNLKQWGISISAETAATIGNWNLPVDNDITWTRSDCNLVKAKSPDTVCVMPLHTAR